MRSTIYGLTLTRESGPSREIQICRDSAPLKMDDLSKLDVRMLQRNSIPYVLQLDVEEVDAKVNLRYRLPLGRGLEPFVRSEQRSMTDIAQVLLTIVLILQDSRLYMLDESKFGLHPDMITVGRDTGEVYLMYLPVRDLQQKRSVRQELYQLTLQMMDWAQVKAEDYPILLDCLKSSLFDLAEFKQLLIGLQAGSGTRQADAMETWSAARPDLETYKPVAEAKPEDRGHGRQEAQDLLHDGDTFRFNPVGFASPANTLRIFLFALILSWGYAAWMPSIGSISVSSCLSVLLAALYYIRLRKQGSPTIMDSTNDPFLTSGNLAGQTDPYVEQDSSSEISHNDSRIERSFDWSAGRQKLYADTPAQTVFLVEPAETVRLVPETELLVPRAVLETEWNGVTKRIELNKDRFLLGRNPDEADWVLNETGISRKHGELTREGGQWSYRDLGSMNGSRLNGEPLQPNQLYILKEGDRVTAGRTDFVFHLC